MICTSEDNVFACGLRINMREQSIKLLEKIKEHNPEKYQEKRDYLEKCEAERKEREKEKQKLEQERIVLEEKNRPSRKILIIDAENCSAAYYQNVIKHYYENYSNANGSGIHFWGLKCQENTYLKKWNGVIDYKIHKHWIEGEPSKNKVDNKIISGVEKLLSEQKFKEITIYCFMTSDGDYLELIERLKSEGKRVIVYGKGNASKQLKEKTEFFNYEKLF